MSNRKVVQVYFQPTFFMLSTVKPFQIFPTYNGYVFFLESFASNRYIFTPLTYKKQLLAFQFRLKQIFFLYLVVISTKCLAFAVIAASSNPSVDHSSRRRLSFFSY